MPPQGISWRPCQEILRYEKILRVVQAAASMGLCKVRLTGGEPLVRRSLPDLVATIARLPAVRETSLTTNGVLLDRYANTLAAAGLARVNISLDTLQTGRFAAITRFRRFEDIWRGIETGYAFVIIAALLLVRIVAGGMAGWVAWELGRAVQVRLVR
jgi:cyclic pyranopterin phosphate synthase